MTHEQLQQIRDALAYYGHSSVSRPATTEAIAILDAELAKPEPKPVGCKHKRYSVDVHEQTGTCYDCGAEGRMRFVVDAPAHPMHEPTAPEQEPVASISVTQLSAMAQSLDVDKNQTGYHWRKGWNDALRQAMDYARTYTTPVPAPQRETDVVEALRRCLDELRGHNDSPYCDLRDSFNDIIEQAESALDAKNVDHPPHARDAVAWMPDTGYVFAPDQNTAPVPAPQRECETCARKRDRLLKAGFLKSPLRTKNEEKNA